MRVLIINCVCGIRSTGRICTELAEEFLTKGDEVRIAYGRVDEVPKEYKNIAVRIGNKLDCAIHAVQTRLFDWHGFGSRNATKKFLKWADTFHPDIVWLHNIHGYYINVEMLFTWIKEHPDMLVKWTLHDCWAFTGHCSHFTAVKCEQWKNHCSYCPQLKSYPSCYGIGNVYRNYERKEHAFTDVKNMQLIVPSKWLAGLVKQSFLREYPVEVRYNTINTDVFKPTESDFRDKYGLQNKKIVLGVASTWNERKGLRDFYKLAEMLDDHYAIVLVGLNKKQMHDLPKNIHGIRRINNSEELAAIYSAADIFANPSVEETFGMATIEAQACGIPSIVYENTACAEVAEQNGNQVVRQDVGALYEAITGSKLMKNREGTEHTSLVYKGCSVIAIPRTNSPIELAQIYSTADVFVNPTYEDNYPTVNLEARACGCRIITYDTGGCRETLL